MTITDRVGRPLEHSSLAKDSSVTKLSVVGAICYALWGGLHLQAAYAVYHVGAALEPGMAQGRVFQDAWNLLFFGVTAIAVALTLNIRNNVWGYWINLGVLTLADTGLIFYTGPRIYAALARRCRARPLGTRLDLYHARLFPTASTTAIISAESTPLSCSTLPAATRASALRQQSDPVRGSPRQTPRDHSRALASQALFHRVPCAIG
jgi:hypothetical protein